MSQAVVTFGVALFIVWTSQMLAWSKTPGGRPLQLADGVSVAALVIGAWSAAKETRKRVPF